MTANAFAISRRLSERGVAKETAEAIAEEIVTHSDESHATKEDVANVRADIVRVETKTNIIIALNLAIIVAFLIDKLTG